MCKTAESRAEIRRYRARVEPLVPWSVGARASPPDPPGLHTLGETLDEAVANAQEALELYVEGLREEGRPLGAGVIRQKIRLPA